MCVTQDRRTIDWIWLQIQRSLLLCDSSGDVRQKINVVEPLGHHLHTYNTSSLRFFIPDGVCIISRLTWHPMEQKRERETAIIVQFQVFCWTDREQYFLLLWTFWRFSSFFSHSTLIYESFKHKKNDETVFCLHKAKNLKHINLSRFFSLIKNNDNTTHRHEMICWHHQGDS